MAWKTASSLPATESASRSRQTRASSTLHIWCRPGDIRRGAAVLAQTVPYLPPAVHVAVVDPGVGTARRAVGVAAGGSIFIGPDNGLLSWAVEAAGGASGAVSLTNKALWRDRVTATFHGRDIFMPVAAHLAAGTPLAEAGDELDVASLVRLPTPESRVFDRGVAGEVVTVDRFGNAQLAATGRGRGARAESSPARRSRCRGTAGRSRCGSA